MTVADENRVRFDRDVGMFARQLGAAPPMGRRATPSEQPGLGKEQRAGAHRAEAAGGRRARFEPGDQRLVAAGGVDAIAAGDDQRIKRRRRRGQGRRAER